MRVHNCSRKYIDGRGSYNDVLKTLNKILNDDRFSDRMKSIWGLSVITGKTEDIKKILLHNKKIGIKHMQMKLVRLNKNNDLSLTTDNIHDILHLYEQLTKYFVECSYRHDYSDLKLILNDNDYFGKIICRVIDSGRIYRRCMAGITKLSFDVDGNIYPCDSFIGNDRFCLGNIYQGICRNKQKELEQCNINGRVKCYNCWAKYICGGDCLHNSYLTNGEIFTPDPVICIFNKRIIEYSFFLTRVIKCNHDLDQLCRYVNARKRFSY